MDVKSKIKQISAGLISAAVLLTGAVQTFTVSAANSDSEFIVGFDAEFPPYGYKDDSGEYVGFDLSLAQEVCDRRGWTLKKQPIEWNSKDMELKTGSIDCIWNGFTMNGRESLYTWSTPYVDNSQVVIVRSSSSISELDDLSGKVVAVQADSSALAALEGEDASEKNKQLCSTFADLQQVGDYNSAFLNLEAGAVDAIAMDIGVANYEIESRGSGFTMLDERLSSEEYGIGFKLGNVELRDQVQETLLEMLDDGTFMKIAAEWGLDDCVCLSHDDVADAPVTKKPSASSSTSSTAKIINMCRQISKGLLSSLSIFLLTLLFSLPLGLLICMGRMSRIKPVQWLVKLYISIVRGTPLMLQLLVVFFAPYYLFGMTLSPSYRFYAVIIGFSMNYAAYFSEIYRSGIQSVPKGQYEACKVLGYSRSQTFFRIIFPQMVKNVSVNYG